MTISALFKKLCPETGQALLKTGFSIEVYQCLIILTLASKCFMQVTWPFWLFFKTQTSLLCEILTELDWLFQITPFGSFMMKR